MRVHALQSDTKVRFYDEPMPDLPGWSYLGVLDLSPGEVAELRLMAEEMRAGRD